MVCCWSNEWVHPYESSWSIIEKFKTANQIDSQDFKNIFGLKNFKLPKNIQNKSSFENTNLYSLSRFDDQKIVDVFGMSIKEHEEDNIKVITSKLPTDNNYFRQYLAYCPECIDMNFHCIFHQFSFLQYCPYHLIPLIKKCIHCTKIILYSISNKYAGVNKRCIIHIHQNYYAIN
jgi:hypothetical protein